MIGGQASVFLSDLTAAMDWPVARQVLDHLELAVPNDEDLGQVLPAGDLLIFVDLGLDEMDLGNDRRTLTSSPRTLVALVACLDSGRT